MIKESDYTISESGCWIWLGKRCSGGRYGYFSMKGKIKMAHRASYETFKGDINDGLFVCHTCDNGLCINPDHLFLGTNSDNMKDAFSKGRLNTNDSSYHAKAGEENFNANLTELEVLEIRAFHEKTNCSYSQLAKRFGLKSRGHAYNIVKRIIWKHI